MTLQSRPRYSVSIVAALRWLIGSGHADRVSEQVLLTYYRRNGHITGHASAGRRGAANRMFYRLDELSLIEADDYGIYHVTREGRRVAMTSHRDPSNSVELLAETGADLYVCGCSALILPRYSPHPGHPTSPCNECGHSVERITLVDFPPPAHPLLTRVERRPE